MKETTLFPDLVLETLPTEGPKYIGSKLKILPHILELAKKVDAKTVFDGFSGTTRVSQFFAQRGYRVLSNDIAVWSKVLGNCYLSNSKEPEYYEKLIEHLNSLPGKDGWFTQNYGGYPNDGYSRIGGIKKPWQVKNTKKLDSIREEIDNLNLCETEKSVLLTSLILALDKVDNTIGHFASYLNKWSTRSYNTLKLRVPKLVISEEKHEVFQSDIFKVLPKIKTDLAYFDPPYGSNNEKMPPSRVRYSAYYHLWTTICLNDKPELFGKVKRRKDSSDLTSPSLFEEFRKGSNGRFIVVDAIDRLIKETRANYIILSYSSGGRATAKELNEVLSNNGKVLDVKEIDYKRNVMGGMRWTEKWIAESEKPNREFLFLLEKEEERCIG